MFCGEEVRVRVAEVAAVGELEVRQLGVADRFGNQCADTEYPDSFAELLAIDAFARAGSGDR